MKNCIAALGTAVAVLAGMSGDVLVASATSAEDIQEKIDRDQKNLDEINGRISALADEQDLVEEEIEDLNAEILNMMTSIGLKTDEIEEKKNDIAEKQIEIDRTQQEYEAAKKREEEQYEAMKGNIRFMYERGEVSVLEMLLGSSGFADFLNKAEYAEMVYQYDHKMLDEYVATKNEVQALWDQLEADKAQLQAEQVQLEADKEALQGLKDELDKQLAQKKRESANYEADIQKYKQEAAAAKKKIQQEQKELKKLQDAAKKGGQVNPDAASGNYKDTGYASVINSAPGSDLGKKVALYACQFIGNPYVPGGTSLTNGADCSGFTYRVYKDFGYTLPRTSYEQRSAGRGVSYSEAQPGDILCYDGHVAIYIGGGMIVHASTQKTGIKIGTNAQYKTILAVRRIV